MTRIYIFLIFSILRTCIVLLFWVGNTWNTYVRIWKSDVYWCWLVKKMNIFWECVLNNISPRGRKDLLVPCEMPPVVEEKLMVDMELEVN